MKKRPKLRVVTGTKLKEDPPIKLGDDGLSLWKDITTDFVLQGAGERRILSLACKMADRAAHQQDIIDGEINSEMKIEAAIKAEIAANSLMARLLQRLGVVHKTRQVGRPANPGFSGYAPDGEAS